MLVISKLSKTYGIRRLDDIDAEKIFALCKANTQFYQYCEEQLCFRPEIPS